MFYANIRNLEGSYTEVLQNRNEYLNRPANDYNKDIQKAGRKLCSPLQIEQFVARKKQRMIKKHNRNVELHNEEYLKYLKERGGDSSG